MTPVLRIKPQPDHPEEKPAGFRPLVSKKYVLPPKPKPGRKRKTPEPEPKAELKAGPAPVVDDDNCGLCSKDDCMCADIGIKNVAPQRTLESIMNDTTYKPAVPLIRPKGSAKVRSGFARLKPSLEATPALNDSESCGFCTDDTPCLCRDEIPEQRPPQQQEQQQQQHQPQQQPQQLNSPQGTQIKPEHQPQHQPHPLHKPQHEQHQHEHQLPQHHLHTHSHNTNDQQPENFDFPELSECSKCTDALSTLFCVSLFAARPLSPTAVSIPHDLAFKILLKHNKFQECDLGVLVSKLEVDKNRNIGVQSINLALHELN